LSDWFRHSRAVTRTRRWAALRLEALRRDGFRCVECGGRSRLQVDHVQPVRTHPELAWSLGNLQTLCGRCHGAKTRNEIGIPGTTPQRRAWLAAVQELRRGK
jgi:5-methylcytosine-specific restriction endonuclease McrA